MRRRLLTCTPAIAALAGCSPLNRAIGRRRQTGVMVMKMTLAWIPAIAMANDQPYPTMTSGRLHDALAPLGADLMVRAMGGAERGALQRLGKAKKRVTYAAKIRKPRRGSTGTGPRNVLRRSHGLSPFPAPARSRSTAKEARLKSCVAVGRGCGRAGRSARRTSRHARGDGAIRILKLQRRQGADESRGLLRGTPLKPPARLG